MLSKLLCLAALMKLGPEMGSNHCLNFLSIQLWVDPIHNSEGLVVRIPYNSDQLLQLCPQVFFLWMDLVL